MQMRRLSVIPVLLMLAAPLAAAEDLAKFEGGIGVNPVARIDPATGLGVRNVVHGVNPGGLPWVIARLEASIGDDGRVSVEGRGLLLAGGDGIGGNGGQSVRAVLFCGDSSFSSDLVALNDEGDFRINGQLSALPPSPCATPVLLIVSGGGNWFAAGIPKR
jgi:hypothetical protein